MQFGKDRILLAEDLLKTLADKTVDKGEGYQRTRMAFGVLLQQYGNAAHLISNFVGGEYMHRDHRGDPNGRDPLEPVKGDKQREALTFLEQHLFSDQAFQFSPQLLRRLAPDRWSHWGNERAAMSRVEYPLNERVLDIQKTALDHLFDPEVLARIQDDALQADKDDHPLTLAELFRGLTDGIWNGRRGGRQGRQEDAGVVGGAAQLAARAPEGPDGAGGRPVVGARRTRGAWRGAPEGDRRPDRQGAERQGG